MITNDYINWHYLTVKILPVLLKEITSDNNGDFYCLKCFYSYSTKNLPKKHKRICKKHNYYNFEMPNKDTKNDRIELRRKIIKSFV